MIIHIDKKSFFPIYEQIKDQIKSLISIGVLKTDDSLPSIRELAADLLINPNTVARAYRDLESDGFIITEKGRGCFVSEESKELSSKGFSGELRELFDKTIEKALEHHLSEGDIRDLVNQRLKFVINKKREK